MEDALVVVANKETTPVIIQTPKQLLENDLKEFILLEYITNYEKEHANKKPIYTANPQYLSLLVDEGVKMKFLRP